MLYQQRILHRDGGRYASLPSAGVRHGQRFGMALSNIVARAIMLTAGATLHVAGKTDIDSSRMAAAALRPIDWLFGPTTGTSPPASGRSGHPLPLCITLRLGGGKSFSP
jgi:hypothetical protein